MSNVFETGVAKFVGTGDPDTNGVTLFYSVLEPNFTEKVFKMFESPVSEAGTRTYKHKGRHATFEILVHLHKFDSTPLASPYNTAKSVANLLLTYENKNVVFFPFYNTTALARPIANERATITAATKANPCQITATAHGFATDDYIKINSVAGMTELNLTDYFKITKIDANNFTLQSIDSTGYGTYTSGGYADRCVLCHLVSIDFNFLKKPGNAYDVCALTFKTNQFYNIARLVKI